MLYKYDGLQWINVFVRYNERAKYWSSSLWIITEGEESEKIVGIPGFFLQALQNHPNIGKLITDDDAVALKALRDIKVEYNVDMSGFKLIFVFAENEYFSNKVHE